jgi:autotransporter-associated beta strand protein
MKILESPAKRLAVVITLTTLNLSVLADQTWLGGSDNQWTTTANWNGAALPGASDQVVYCNLSTANLSNWLSQAFTIKGFTVSNVPGPVSINSASTLTVPNGINMTNAVQSLTLSAPIALGASIMGPNLSWYVTNAAQLNVPGVVSGSGGLYKDGSGTLYLSATNTFTGNFTNNGGAVWINNANGVGGGGSTKNITIANNSYGAGLHLNGTNGNIIFPNNYQFIASQNQGTVFNEAGNNVIPGNIYVTSGGGDAYFVVNTGTLVLNGPVATISGARNFQLGGVGNGTNNGAITSSGLAFRKMDAGTWTLTNNNTFTGTAIVEGGTLILTATAKMGSAPSITVFNNATLDVSAVITSGSNAFALTAGQILAGGGTVNGNVNASAAGSLIQPGSLNVHNSAGGTGAAGTLSISGSLFMGPTTTNYFEMNASTTVGGGVNDLVTVGGNLDPQGAYISIATLNGLVNGTYRLFNYTGAKLSSFNATCLSLGLRGTFTIDESVTNQINLIVSGVVNPVWAGTGSSSPWDLNTTADWNNNTLTFLNGDSVTFDDTGTAPTVNLSGTVQPGSVNFNNSSVGYTLAGSGKITGPSGLNKSGSGTVTITATASDFIGPVTINSGTLSVGTFALNGSASPLGAGSNVVLNGGTFQMTGARPNQGTVNRFWTLGPNGGTVQSTTATFFMLNPISGPGSLTKAGSQQIILGDILAGLLTAANNTYSGNTYITQGELQIRSAHAVGTGKIVVSTGADLAVGGGANYGTITNNIDLNGLDTGGLGAIRIGDTSTGMNFGGTITLLGNSSVGSQNATASSLTFTISGPIVGSGSLTKLQTAAAPVTCTLSGTNTYTGNTIITGGTLAVGIGGVGAISNTPSISIGNNTKLQLNSGALLGSAVNISIAAGGYFDVNGLGAGTTYSLGSGATLNASGTGTTSLSTQAEIHGSSGGTVSLGSRPISLTFTPGAFTGDTTHPALVISQGSLQLSANVITINNAAGTALGAGTYRVIQVGNGTSGSISGTPTAAPFITGKGLAAGMTAALSVSSGNVVLTVTSTSPAATTTTLNGLTGSSYGSSVTFTATVAPIPTSGTVQFYDNGVAIGSPVTVSSGTASLTTSALWAGTHPITAAYSGASGYAPSVTGSASSQVVSAVALGITANADSKSYGQTKTYGARSTAFTTSGLQNGETITSLTLTSSGASATAASGSYNLTPSAAVGGAFNANNYTITYNNGTLTVNPATLSITASADSKPYGQTKTYGAGSTAFTSSGLQNGETIGSVTITASGGAAATAPVASYTLTPSAAAGGTFTAGNYTITYNSSTLMVNPAALSITASADSKTYGQTKTYGAGSTAFTSSGLQNGETIGSITLTDSGNGGLATASVGSYSLSASAATGGTFTASNYTITYHSGALTVGAAALDITANNATKDCSQSLTFAGTEFTTGAGQLVNGNTVTSVTLTSSGAASGASTGLYDIVPSAAVGSGLGNYSIAYHKGTLTVSDTTPPAIVYYFTNLTLSTTSSNCQVVLPDLTGTNYIIAVDNCSSSVTVTQNPSANTLLSLGTNLIVLTAIDASGNATNSTNTVVVADTFAPVVTLLGCTPLTNECHTPFADPGATALDNCAGVVSVTTNGTVNPNSVGVYTIDYVASDPSGNTATNTRTVYVVDTTAPVIALNGANPLLVECHSGFSDPGATAMDACVGSVAVTTSGSVDPNTPGSYTLTYTAGDGNGNTNSAMRTVSVQDTTPPAIVYYFTNLTLSTTSSNCQALLPDLTGTNYIIAVDLCSSSVTVTQNPPANTWLPLGTNQVVLTAFDPSGNAANSTNAVIVADTAAPLISCPADISIVTTDPTGANASFTVTATDNCDPSPTTVSTPASGSFFLAGTNTVSCYAYDASGNTNTCSFLVIVDRAPVVQSSVSGSVTQNQLLTVDLAKLLAVVSDPDNDPLSVIAAGPTSTNGGTVTLTSTSVTYQPVVDFVGADLFSYTVSDGRGGLATNTLAVNVVAATGLAPNVVYGPVISNGLFIVRFAGIPGYTYTVEATDDLGSLSWTKKANLTAPTTDQGLGIGIFEFSESVGSATSRYYRTMYPSY